MQVFFLVRALFSKHLSLQIKVWILVFLDLILFFVFFFLDNSELISVHKFSMSL